MQKREADGPGSTYEAGTFKEIEAKLSDNVILTAQYFGDLASYPSKVKKLIISD